MFRSHFRQQYSAFCRRLFFPVFLRRRASSESRGGASSSLSSKHRKKERKKERRFKESAAREREKLFFCLLSLGSRSVTKKFPFFCSSFPLSFSLSLSLSLFPTHSLLLGVFSKPPKSTALFFWSFFKAPFGIKVLLLPKRECCATTT
jgi:hypothetical protein